MDVDSCGSHRVSAASFSEWLEAESASHRQRISHIKHTIADAIRDDAHARLFELLEGYLAAVSN